MSTRSVSRRASRWLASVMVIALLFPAAGAGALPGSQKSEHTGTRLEGYATVVTPNSITVFDRKKREFKIMTDKDYTALVGAGAAVTVWYIDINGVYHLEDITYPEAGGTFVSTDLIRQSTRRIIVLPEPEGVENTQGLMEAIGKYLSDNAGWYVAPPDLAREIANRSKAPGNSLDAINPDTGDVDMQKYLQPQTPLVVSIADETRSDAVLEVKVVKVKADVRESIAAWDNMTEPVSRHKSFNLLPFGGSGKGWAYAATADMSLWSRTGKLLWKKRRGFALLGVKTDNGSKFRERPLTEVYANSDFMQRWLADTLGELAPPRGAVATP